MNNNHNNNKTNVILTSSWFYVHTTYFFCAVHNRRVFFSYSSQSIGRVMILWEEGGIELKKDLRQINGARLDL